MLLLHIPLIIKAKNSKTFARNREYVKHDEALRFAETNAESDDRMIWSCASKLRNDIFAAQSKQVCEPVTIDNILEG